jgi:(1->4)-alpha-D-glucan 1-alpha-D-glucosylmutase
MRMRLNLLSEVPQLWAQAVQRWRRLNRSLRIEFGGRRAPSRPDEYVLYQTLVGAWPVALVGDDGGWPSGIDEFRRRIKQYFIKAVREAKTVSSWTDQDELYEKGCLAFVDTILDENGNHAFLGDCRAFVRRVACAAMLNGLSQTVLKCCSPGVPDIYQGTEFWDLNLVDPDNRRTVDFAARRRALAALSGAEAAQGLTPATVRRLLRHWPDGHIKLHILRRCLQVRQARSALFVEGSYEPLTVRGEHAHHVVAFARRHQGDVAVIAAGRLFAALQSRDDDPTALRWGDSALQFDALGQTDLVDAFAGRRIAVEMAGATAEIPLGSLFETLPVAVLTASPTRPLPRRPRPGSRL